MDNTLVIPAEVRESFTSFVTDSALLALPLILEDNEVQSQPAITLKASDSPLQQSLNQLDDFLDSRKPLYLLLRRDTRLVAVTYVPFLAKEAQRTALLHHRHELLHQLGEDLFSSSLICKEIGEVTDARSWDERDAHSHPVEEKEHEACEPCEKPDAKTVGLQDLGYKKNKCRLCDRRMKNKIDERAIEAFTKLEDVGSCVQISVDITTEILMLNFYVPDISPSDVASRLPTDRPSFTFYRHPDTNLLYFIFCSPDSASVKERMKHTMAIPGLVNVHAQDNGVYVDQKLEIHDPEDLVFEGGDARIGKFRSMYLRNKFEGTESVYESMGTDKAFLDAVV